MPSHLRPHFFIIGERKCGTSSLYRYLLEHPMILPGTQKEMQFFSRPPDEIASTIEQYLAQFPLIEGGVSSALDWPELNEGGKLYHEALQFERVDGKRYVTGEASADTFEAVPPSLLKQYLPKLRLLLLLRDPVERAFSHHRMFHRFQEEGRSLGFSVGSFESDMQMEMQAVRRGQRAPCLSPGLYIDKLKPWVDTWGKDKLLVLFSDSLSTASRCKTTMSKVIEHLQLPAHNYESSLALHYNQAPAEKIPRAIAAELEEFYHPYSCALQEYLALPLPWLREEAGVQA